MTEDRYIKQRQLKIIGNRGQELLGKSKAVIIGLGGLGSVIAMELARAGVGFLRLVDSDIVEVQNLHRQILYTLKDAENNRYKTDAAKEHLFVTALLKCPESDLLRCPETAHLRVSGMCS